MTTAKSTLVIDLSSPMSYSSARLTDSVLYELCKKYGSEALLARRKFAGLLPEVFRRRLFERKGFGSIYEFSAKLGGMSRDQVDLVLRLERRFEKKEILKNALVEGEVSVNKLKRIVSVATEENQTELLEKTKILSSRALETFVRDIKNQNGLFETTTELKSVHVHGFENQNGLFQAKNKAKTGHATTFGNSNTDGLDLADDVRDQLIELQQKGIDINEFLRESLNKRKLEIAQEKEELSKEILEKADERKIDQRAKGKKDESYKKITQPSRYIPAKIKRIIHQEHGTKCSILSCHKPAETLHHTQRFSLSQTHDPRYLAPLCREHHEIAHAIDLKVQAKKGG